METILRKEIITNKILCRAFGVLIFVTFTALGAFVRIPLPFTPVPITLQTFFVLLSGLFLGAGLGAAAQLSYLFFGFIGVTLFTGAGSGLLYLSGPTGGYLFGFVLASLFIGRFVRYSRNNIFLTFAVVFIADIILLASGVIWLKAIFGYSFKKLMLIGFIPFIPGDILKAAAATLIFSKFKSRIKEVF
jgi:biotin transport system substrate-specific component